MLESVARPSPPGAPAAPDLLPDDIERLRVHSDKLVSKPLLFVAMPFRDDMADHYDYGILNAAERAGFLCERADQAHFTGDILDWVRRRIKAATLVVADLSYANPNVYLEVGYSWGLRKPTVLLVRDSEELKFDVRGQRCLVYKHQGSGGTAVPRTPFIKRLTSRGRYSLRHSVVSPFRRVHISRRNTHVLLN